MQKFSKSFLILFLLVGILSCKEEKTTVVPQPISVKTTTVSNFSNAENGMKYSGTISAEKLVNLTFQVAGTVETLPVNMGDFVTQNSLIGTVDVTAYESQYQARAAQAKLAKENYERIREVYEKGSIAEIRMIEAKSNYEQATAAANAVYQNVKHARLTAPFSGYVGNKMLEVGDVASPGRPVIQLMNIDVVKAVIPIPSEEINHYRVGDSANVTIDALENEMFQGVVKEVAVASNRMNPVYNVQISIENPERTIKPGMACTIQLQVLNEETTKPSMITVPLETVSVNEDGTNYVYIYNTEKNIAQRKKVTLGKLFNNRIEIVNGVSNKDKIITSGYHKLTDGTPVILAQ
ncbi:RND family efflux transporter, MFP subunit [Pustulibacterium marinum]|uniref:RND family efflux transporter, MFP subunit n=1 Tax=Pustulibacterium marinum TaxID=1224947 RepID=A0A1I7GDK0_9FLAO|nr:efflux RND transporter periplasmic adaptor subunit [Pustulibacterium marinum]SFU46520.1 RND family efflux transporter, MFP subunit [Pustulibacterium marinum]